MSRNPAKFSPSEIRFSHDSISYKFRDGTLVQQTVTQLKNGAFTIDDIPKIKIVKRDGLNFSINNRRLYVFQQYEKFLRRRGENIAIPVEYGTHKDLKEYKLTTRNEGLTVRIGRREMPENTICLRISEIRYSRNAIYSYFRKERESIEMLENLENGIYTIDSLPKITVVQSKKVFYAIDNERVLWVIKQYSERQSEDFILTCSLGKYSDLKPTSFTTATDGSSVRQKKKPMLQKHQTEEEDDFKRMKGLSYNDICETF